MAWLSKPPCGIQLNRNHPLAQGLVGCWLFNEGAGLRANDLSGNNNTGVLTNFEPMSATSGWTGGNQGNELQFNGTNANVDCGISEVLRLTQSVSIEAWINSRNPASSTQWIAGNDRDCCDVPSLGGYSLSLSYPTLNGRVNFGYWKADGTGVLYFNSNTVLKSNTIYHIIATFSGTNVSIYINGTLDSSNNFTADTIQPATKNFKIGLLSSGAFFPFNGTIRLVRIWNIAKSPQQVQQLYAQPYAIFWNPSERIRKNYDNEILI